MDKRNESCSATNLLTDPQTRDDQRTLHGSTLKSPTLTAILPTYHRSEDLRRTLANVLHGKRVPDALVIVDNGRDPETAVLLNEATKCSAHTSLTLLEPHENLGSAGGWAYGMRHVLPDLQAHDWILILDDDDPPHAPDEIDQMWQFAVAQHEADPTTAAVGIVGARFDWRKGVLQRLSDDEIEEAVDVDYVGSGHVAMYRVSALLDAGVFREELFFGHTEVEFGLRLRRAGYRIVANGELWKNRRELAGRCGVELHPSRQCQVSWRRYYVIRYHVYMMRRFGRWDLALKHALIQIFAKPAYTLVRDPRLAIGGFWQGLRASWDGWFGRMGRRREPD